MKDSTLFKIVALMGILMVALSSRMARAQVEWVTDADADRMVDALDNCVSTTNATQADYDKDGYGDLCDADFNNDGTVSFADVGLFARAFGNASPAFDLDGSGGIVNFSDLARVRALFGRSPGPAGQRLVTVGGYTYNFVRCLGSNCALNVFDPSVNVPTGTVLAGQKCWPVPPNNVPAGAGRVWGMPSLTDHALTLCVQTP